MASDYPRLDLKSLGELTFFEPDLEKFECLKLAHEVIESGGLYPVVLNAANEVAVSLFLNSKIKFTDIPAMIKSALDNFSDSNKLTLEDIIHTDSWTREFLTKPVVYAH